MGTTDFSKGSVWSYWDLHLHAPGTLFNDQFKGDWDAYLKVIEESEVQVLGVTDYFSLKCFLALKKYKDDGRLKNVQAIIPNIEIRMTPATRRGAGVNSHLLIDPQIDEIERKVQRLFQSFEFGYDGENYRGDVDGLVELGRAFSRNQSLEEQAALKVGAQQFKISPQALLKARKENAWMQESVLIGVSAGNDGLSGLRHDGQFRATHDEICRLADFIFSGSEADISYWGLKRAEFVKEVKDLGGPKACLHGCDAHDIQSLLKPANDRMCWIKAEHTFEGLRQAILEPLERVEIGPTNPSLRIDQAQVIDHISISNHSGWFTTEKISLNHSLVSIVGKKGSGKSALAELIAVAAGHEIAKDDKRAFLNRAAPVLADIEVELTWGDGGKSAYKGGKSSDATSRVRFLSQSFVDELCSSEDKGARLAQEIEAVVFDFVDVAERGTATNFKELRTLRTKSISINQQNVRKKLETLNVEAQKLHERRAELPQKVNNLEQLEKQKAAADKEIASLQTVENKEYFERMEVLNGLLQGAQKNISVERERLAVIDEISTLAGNLGREIVDFRSRITSKASEASLDIAEILSFFPEIQEPKLAQSIEAIRNPVEAKISELIGAADEREGITLAALKSQLAALNKEQSDDQVRRDKLLKLSAAREKLIEQLTKLTEDIQSIQVKERDRLEANREQRIALYKQYAELVFAEQRVLQDLYAPVQEFLGAGSENEKRLELDLRFNVDEERWFTQAREIINRSRNLNWSGDIVSYSDLEDLARKTVLKAWESGNVEQIELEMRSFLEEIRKGDDTDRDFLRSSKTYEDFLSWLYDTSFVSVSYSLRYDKTPIEKLSPGTRGIILLVLYLGISKDDRRPLIVDQPEENLDNDSIYADLVGYFREAKRDRQVILVSHNPNLVVNTDSEQVIIAEATKRDDGSPEITYIGGAIEDKARGAKSTLGQVCTVLEGGPTAFGGRRAKYEYTRWEEK